MIAPAVAPGYDYGRVELQLPTTILGGAFCNMEQCHCQTWHGSQQLTFRCEHGGEEDA